MKKENKISAVTFLVAIIFFIISRIVKNILAGGILCVIGIIFISTSIICEKKAKNKQNFGIFAILSKIVKSKKK